MFFGPSCNTALAASRYIGYGFTFQIQSGSNTRILSEISQIQIPNAPSIILVVATPAVFEFIFSIPVP